MEFSQPIPDAPSDTTSTAEVAPPSRRRSDHLLREIVDTAFLTALIFLLVNAATGRFQIESVSMQPALQEGERVIVDKISYLLGAPQRGDIVVLSIEGEPKDLIKRIIGLPGETIELAGGIIYIDGQPLDEPYLAPGSTGAHRATRLGADEYFVMGDNRNNSRDSRSFGPIRREAIVGRAWIIYWPVTEWGFVARPVYAVDHSP